VHAGAQMLEVDDRRVGIRVLGDDDVVEIE
jgi:hypothetical protein